jgi:leucyl-tRNA synthetase
MGIPDSEIHNFTDPEYWCKYFPPIAQRDLKRFGVQVDFDRSFITTYLNPFYDKFVSWQFTKLKEG